MTSPRIESRRSLRRTARRCVAALRTPLFAATLLVASSASASEDYPKDIETYWRISSLPVKGMGCMLCHSSDLGGVGTVVQPFGKTMRANGLTSGSPTSLYNTLKYVTAHAFTPPIIDSDGDGVPDYTEIAVDHTNPNDPHDFKPPVVQMTTPNGGEGGDTSLNEVGGAGGQVQAVQEEPPAFEPPPVGDLPPPFVHGCAVTPHASHDVFGWSALVGIALLGRRRARRRTRNARA
jgi:hypothetical protein